ncbi:MAG: cellulase family glycosylhydrolase [Lachnospiraceae bacterium]|nr:cellulase family glycosylhydrolase [Lachnospiraceae bacterium]
MRIKRVVALLLCFTVALSFLMPEGFSVAAADTAYSLVTNQTGSGTVAKNGYGTDYILDFYENTALSSAFASNPSSFSSITFEASVTVNSVSNSGLTMMAYAMNTDYGEWSEAASSGTISAGQTYKLSLNLKSYSNLGKLGLRVAGNSDTDGATLNYTINYAKVVVGESSSGASTSTTQAASGTGNVSDVSLTLTEGSGSNEYYKEYVVRLTNNSSSSITGIQCLMPTSKAVSGVQCYGSGLKASYSAEHGGVLFYYSLKIDAGATAYSTDTKFGFSLNGATTYPSNASVLDVNCASASSSSLKYTLTGSTENKAFADTPVGQHGALHTGNVSGYKAPVIVGEDGYQVNLRGASTHGMHWNAMTPYVNKAAFQTLRDEWGVNTVRLVSYVTQGGYTAGSQATLDTAIQNGVKYAKELGMYAIVDWHIHEENPWTTVDSAKAFFTKYATMYKDYDNVIFEICNEPTGIQWYTGGSDLHSYCTTIAKIIRDCGSNAIIVCGTNTWSQDVDEVIGHDLNDEGFSNIMYTFHFYAASHYQDKMNKVTTAYNAGIPIFVTEFGTCDASGGGGYDFDNANAWIKLLDSYGIPYCNWSLCNKAEAASMLSTSCSSKTGGWKNDDLSESGAWLVNTYREHQDAEEGTDTKAKETTTEEPTTEEATTEASKDATTTEATTEEVTTEENSIVSVKLDKTTLSLDVSAEATLKATVKINGEISGAVKWSSSDKSVVTVDESGKIKALKGGTATITVMAVEDETKKATCKVTVNKLVQEFKKTLTVTKVSSDAVSLSDLGEGVEYNFKLKGAAKYADDAWLKAPVITNLSEYTDYTFAARLAESDIYKASDIVEVSATTLIANPYTIDLSLFATVKDTDALVAAYSNTVSYDKETKTLTLLEDKEYTLTGTAKDISVVSKTTKIVTFDNVSIKSFTSAVDTSLALEGTSLVSEGISSTGTISFANSADSNAKNGVISISNKSGSAAVSANAVVVSGGEVKVTTTGNSSAIAAYESVKLESGTLDLTVDESSTAAAIDTPKVVFIDTSLAANVESIYSENCSVVDADGNPVEFATVTYLTSGVSKDAKVRKGASVTLPNVEAKVGFKADGWKSGDKTYKVGETVVVNENITFEANYIEIKGSLDLKLTNGDVELTEGYKSGEDVSVLVITNNSNVTIDAITVSVPTGSKYTLSKTKITNLEAGKSVTISISIKAGLSAGDYAETITVTTSGEVEGSSVKVSRKVIEVIKEEVNASGDAAEVTTDPANNTTEETADNGNNTTEETKTSKAMNKKYKVFYKLKGKTKKMPKILKIKNKKKYKLLFKTKKGKKGKSINAKKLKFKVAKKKILKITAKGVIKAKKAGVTKVTIIYPDGTKKTIKIKVFKKAVKK